MSIYDDLQAVASGVLKEFNQGVIKLVKLTPGAGSVDDPGTATRVEYTLDATAKGISFKYLKDGFTVVSDKEVVAAVVSGVTPGIDDLITIDGEEHKIIQDLSVPGSGTRCAWKFIVRRGA
jgi:hypothetical protein